jgi:capsular polysaccharide transport system permease protein
MNSSFVDRLKAVDRIALFTVILPTLIATVYFGLIASKVYVSESRFVIRSTDQQTASPIGLLLKGAGISRSDDDAYAVQGYIMSRDALADVDKQLNLREMYTHSGIDPISRFPGLTFDHSFESFYLYYLHHVDVSIDPMSSILTLTVRSFDRRDSMTLNRILLEKSEALVNQMNQRARQDLIAVAEHRVQEAAQQDQEAEIALSAYRNEASVINPEAQSALPLQTVAKIREQLLVATTNLSQLELTAKDNPQIPALKRRIDDLEKAILAESNGVAGDDNSLASKAVVYQRLALAKEFDDKMLATEMASLEQARTEADHKQLYLERIAEPNEPDKAMEPHRIRAIAATFGIGLLAWGVVSMLFAAIREHHD